MSTDYNEFKGKRMINWLPQKDNIKIKILMPNNMKTSGVAEGHIKSVKEGEVIQFERAGFCRLDNKKANFYYYTHK